MQNTDVPSYETTNANSNIRDFLISENFQKLVRALPSNVTTSSIDKGILSLVPDEITLCRDTIEILQDTSISWAVRKYIAEKVIFYNKEEQDTLLIDYEVVDNFSALVNQRQAQDINYGEQVTNTRDLILYYREDQGGFEPHFIFIAQLLKKYVDNGYSPVWNSFKIVTRYGEQKSLGGISTEKNFCGNEFREQTSLFADTIHLSHGTPEETPGTHSIIGTAILRDKNKANLLNDINYTPVDLLYYGGENIGTLGYLKNTKNLGFPINKSAENISKLILDALQEAEKSILSHTNEIPGKVDSIITGN